MMTDVSTGAGGATTICRVADTFAPPALAIAVTVTVPAATPLTRPLPLTVATMADDVLHATLAVRTLPF